MILAGDTPLKQIAGADDIQDLAKTLLMNSVGCIGLKVSPATVAGIITDSEKKIKDALGIRRWQVLNTGLLSLKNWLKNRHGGEFRHWKASILEDLLRKAKTLEIMTPEEATFEKEPGNPHRCVDFAPGEVKRDINHGGRQNIFSL